MDTKIQAYDFVSLFAAGWDEAKIEQRIPCDNPYEDRDAWKYFIEGEDGLIHRMMKKIETKGTYLLRLGRR
jgi:hypothetical protein